jgi:8-oxo-dGTP diphosphatase
VNSELLGVGNAAEGETTVVAAALVEHGRVLAARRVRPDDVAGGWELPGGKVHPDETPAEAVVRELAEELGCVVEALGPIEGRVPIKPGYALVVERARLVRGEPVPQEHDAIRWLGPEDLGDVEWLPADRPFLAGLRELLLDGEAMTGGNVGGAARIGRTVRRSTGPWSPAVHGLLDRLAEGGLDAVPQVLGTDARGREVLSFVTGRVPDVDHEVIADETRADAMRWLRRYHEAVAGYRPDGRWRSVPRPLAVDEIVCHHDFAPYNVTLSPAAAGERVTGVFDWDMAGPGIPIDDLAFAAWNWVPLFRDVGLKRSVERVALMASAYGNGVTGEQILDRLPIRLQRALDSILAGQRAGDPGMLNLARVGEPERSANALADLVERLPAIRQALSTDRSL